ncbi:MAG: glycosyltransferase family 4 protein [Thiohalospira sp.]
MKILYYHQYFKTRQGSGGTRSYEFAKRLIEKGHEVTIVCARRRFDDLSIPDTNSIRKYRKGIIEGIKVIQIDLFVRNKDSLVKRAFKFLKFAIVSIKFVFTEKYDIIFATSTPLTIGIPGLLAKFFISQKRFVFEVRDLWPELPRAMGEIKNPIIFRVLKWLEKRIYKSADALIGLSPGMVDGIAKNNISYNKITLIPNGCDLDLFMTDNQFEKNIIQGCKKTDFIAIYTGTHGKANGLSFVLKVAETLKRLNIHQIKLVLIGDGAEKECLIKKAKELQLNNCIFLNRTSKIEIAKYLSVADIGMMILADIPAFAYGTSPNKFFDYIASGLPVLVNHFGWVADLVIENECGYAYRNDQYLQYAEKLICLNNNKSLCERLSLNARKLAEKEFDRNILSDKFISFLTNS